MLGWLVLACGGGGGTLAPVADTAVDECRGYDWDTVGAPFLFTWCTTCHSAAAADRNGAPVGVDLDTLEGARTWAVQIESLAVDSRAMPPAGGPRAGDLEVFATWLDCGLPE
jgi:uncharacterized membrane protein